MAPASPISYRRAMLAGVLSEADLPLAYTEQPDYVSVCNLQASPTHLHNPVSPETNDGAAAGVAGLADADQGPDRRDIAEDVDGA